MDTFCIVWVRLHLQNLKPQKKLITHTAQVYMQHAHRAIVKNNEIFVQQTFLQNTISA